LIPVARECARAQAAPPAARLFATKPQSNQKKPEAAAAAAAAAAAQKPAAQAQKPAAATAAPKAAPPSSGSASGSADKVAGGPNRKRLSIMTTHGKFAHALLEVAEKRGRRDAVEKELVALSYSFQKNERLNQISNNPAMLPREKLAVIQPLLEKMKLDKLTQNLVVLLIRNKRLAQLSKVVEAYSALCADARGEVRARIVSADPLSKEQVAALTGALQKKIESWQKLSVVTEVDPSIIGGLKIEVGDKGADLSIASRLTGMEEKLRRISVPKPKSA
jgi:ATP synthase F1 delta subunit